MTLKLLPFFLIVSGSFGGCPLARAANDDPSSAADIQQLIAQLGDEQYVLRQRAETQLVERGAEVFAELKAAENHADLEIATRAKYLLSQIRIEWIRPTDPPVVRSIMARYGELSQAAPRLAIVGKLSRLEHEQGFGALCRIARFETSGPVAPLCRTGDSRKKFLAVRPNRCCRKNAEQRNRRKYGGSRFLGPVSTWISCNLPKQWIRAGLRSSMQRLPCLPKRKGRQVSLWFCCFCTVTWTFVVGSPTRKRSSLVWGGE